MTPEMDPPNCTEEALDLMKGWAAADGPDAALSRRAKFVLGTLEGLSDSEASVRAGIDKKLGAKWKMRFDALGPKGLLDKSKRPGRAPSPPYNEARDTVLGLLGKEPPGGRGSWSVAGVVQALKLPRSLVVKILGKEGVTIGRQKATRRARTASSSSASSSSASSSSAASAASEESVAALKALAVGGSGPVAALRAKTVLKIIDGCSYKEIASELGTAPRATAKWAKAFASKGAEGLIDRSTKKGTRHEAVRSRVLELLKSPRPDGSPGWSTESLALKLELPIYGVRKILNEEGIRLQRPEVLAQTAAAGARPESDMETLRLWAGGGSPDELISGRAKSVLGLLEGLSAKKAGELSGFKGITALKWLRSFSESGPDGLRNAPPARKPAAVTLRDDELEKLRRVAEGEGGDHAVALKAKVALLNHGKTPRSEIANRVNLTRQTVSVWLKLLAKDGLDAFLSPSRARPPKRVVRTEADMADLRRLAGGAAPDQATVKKAKIVLMSLEGYPNWKVAKLANVDPSRVDTLKKLFAEHGPAGLVATRRDASDAAPGSPRQTGVAPGALRPADAAPGVQRQTGVAPGVQRQAEAAPGAVAPDVGAAEEDGGAGSAAPATKAAPDPVPSPPNRRPMPGTGSLDAVLEGFRRLGGKNAPDAETALGARAAFLILAGRPVEEIAGLGKDGLFGP
ncbi:MAG: helix-turn-helix domain-containing protein, partial [Deltaproteobacteria bacterium]|nr:helix-turn-helix domain-containing protein [Deltaproteobacteria bacterium]